MSYCVNCGVELDGSAKKCPLCDTPVINPKELEKIKQDMMPFPNAKGEVEKVKRKDLGILLSAVVVSIAVCCGILNAYVFKGSQWSLAVIGVCAIVWVLLIPAVINRKQPVYLTVLFDGAIVLAYLYLLTYLTGSNDWFLLLGVPIVVFVTVIVEAYVLCVRVLPKSYLTIALYSVIAIALLCVGLEIMIDYFKYGAVSLGWSAVVLTICTILAITFSTMLSRRRLRNAVRRRLHF